MLAGNRGKRPGFAGELRVMTASYDEASDRAFARFVRTRDPDDLAAVFDAVAPRLALVAQQLVGDPHAAEDLVQTTFLEALRAVDRFEPGRPVRPWLTTILTRRAANELRRRRRHGTPGDDQGIGDHDHPADPVQHAVDAELVERVEAALAALPTEQRQALTLRLLHGLRPVDIARALERPLGTVHAQLHRGLAALRGRLPAGLLTLWAAMLGDEARAAARETVLAAARAFGRTGTPLVVVGGLRVAMAALLLAVVAGGGWLWWNSVRESESQPSPSTPTAAVARSSGGDDLGAVGSAAALARTGLLPTTAADLSGPRATLRGRIVAAEDRAPLAHVAVEVRGGDDVTSSVTDAEGRFVVRCVADAARGVRLGAAAGDRRIAAFVELPALTPGADLDLGDLPLEQAVTVRLRARVRGSGAPPPAGVRLGLVRDDVGARRWILDRAWRPAFDAPSPVMLDAEGRSPSFVVAPGRWRVARFDRLAGRIESAPMSVAAGDDALEHPVEVVLPDAGSAVTGQVVDSAGQPLPGGTPIVLEVVADGSTVMQDLGDGGAFRFGPFDAVQAAAGLRVVRVGAGPAELDGTAWTVHEVTPGTLLRPGVAAQVRVATVSPATWTLAVRGGDRVRWARTPIASSPAGCWCAPAGEASRGVGPVDRLGVAHPGERWVSVRSDDRPGTAVVGLPVRFTAGVPTITTVDLGATTAWRIEIVDERGVAVVGAQVELLRRLGDLPGMPASEVALESLFERGLEPPVVDVVGPGALTGPDGVAVLETNAWLGAAARLRVRSARHLADEVALPERARSTEVRRVLLREAMTWHGRVGPLDVLDAWTATPAERAFLDGFAEGAARLDERRPFLVLRDPDGEDVARVRIDAEGCFVSGPLAARGAHAVELALGLSTGAAGRVEQRVLLGTWPLAGHAPGERVVYDLSEFRPARLSGRVFLDGRPLVDGVVRIAAESVDPSRSVPSRSVTFARDVRTDGGGRFAVADALLPGRYRLAVVRSGAGLDELVWSEGTVDLPPGAEVVHEVRAVTRAWSVRVETAAGRPASGRRVGWRIATSGDPLRGSSAGIGLPLPVDAAGVVRIAPLPVPDRAPHGIELLVVDEGADPGRIDLALGQGGVTRYGPFPVDGAAPTLRLGERAR